MLVSLAKACARIMATEESEESDGGETSVLSLNSSTSHLNVSSFMYHLDLSNFMYHLCGCSFHFNFSTRPAAFQHPISAGKRLYHYENPRLPLRPYKEERGDLLLSLSRLMLVTMGLLVWFRRRLRVDVDMSVVMGRRGVGRIRGGGEDGAEGDGMGHQRSTNGMQHPGP